MSCYQDIRSAILHRRSIRKFQAKAVDPTILKELIDLARFHATGGNLQPLRFGLIASEDQRNAVFGLLKWAMYLPEFTVSPTEQPGGYIVIFSEKKESSPSFDIGAAATTIMLAAESYGLSSCCLGAVSAAKLAALLQLPETLKPELVIALGYPAHESNAVAFAGDVKYSMDENGNFFVPKRSLSEVLVYSDSQ